MAWTIEFAATAAKELSKLDRPVAKRIVSFLRERVARDPKAIGEALQGNLAEYWRYRVGDYRIICEIQEEKINVAVVRIGHRREVYR
jgi:mRNA interferase RelE/StbE